MLIFVFFSCLDIFYIGQQINQLNIIFSIHYQTRINCIGFGHFIGQINKKYNSKGMSSRLRQTQNQQQLMDAERILINPLNRSTSKQQYSFSKAQRFQRCKTQNEDYHFYNIPSTRSRKGTIIGKSQRDSPSFKDNPTPVFYNYATDGEFAFSVNLKNSKNKGYGFGLGRNEIKVNSFITIKKDVPDSWAYNPSNSLKKGQRQFSFSKAKKFSLSKIQLNNCTPGPAKYKTDSSLDQTKQVLSNYPKAAFPKMMEIKKQSRKSSPIKYPPLYHPKTTAKGDILQFNRIKKGAIIGSSKRYGGLKSNHPGPGQYKIFSQFISKGKK